MSDIRTVEEAKVIASEIVEEAKLMGIRMAAAQASQYDSVSAHPYVLEDCILAKFNLLPKERIRKNKRAVSLES